jgi:hypothetical protein
LDLLIQNWLLNRIGILHLVLRTLRLVLLVAFHVLRRIWLFDLCFLRGLKLSSLSFFIGSGDQLGLTLELIVLPVNFMSLVLLIFTLLGQDGIENRLTYFFVRIEAIDHRLKLIVGEARESFSQLFKFRLEAHVGISLRLLSTVRHLGLDTGQ